AERLAGLGARVLALDNLSAADPAGLAALRATPGVELLEADILLPVPLAAALRGADYVVHLAAISNPRTCKEDVGRAFDVNVVGLKNVLEATPTARRVAFLSSAWVYGDPVRLPMDESHPTNGSDPYSLGKLMGELLCRSYADAG